MKRKDKQQAEKMGAEGRNFSWYIRLLFAGSGARLR